MGQLPIHVDVVPEYEVSGDCVLLRWHDIEVFVPVPICRLAVRRCQQAIDDWDACRGELLEFPAAAG